MLPQETRLLPLRGLPRIDDHRGRTTQKSHQAKKLGTDTVTVFGASRCGHALDQTKVMQQPDKSCSVRGNPAGVTCTQKQ